MRLNLQPAVVLPLVLLGACATAFSINNIREGDTRESVEAHIGAPSAVYTMADGHARLEYHRLSLGLQTYMIDFDALGRVAHVDQVLDENHFLKIQAGMSEGEVLSLIGPPNGYGHFSRPVEATTWIYRFETIQKCIVFQLPFDVHTHRTLEGGSFPPDKSCGPILT